MAGIFHIQTCRLFRIHFFDEAGRNTAPEFTGSDDCIFQDQGTGRHDGSFTYFGEIEYGGSHANQRMLVYGTAVKGDMMPHGNIVLNENRSFAAQRVQATAVLDVDPVSYFDVMYIAAQHRVEPDAAFISHRYIADDAGSFSQIASFAEPGCYSF